MYSVSVYNLLEEIDGNQFSLAMCNKMKKKRRRRRSGKNIGHVSELFSREKLSWAWTFMVPVHIFTTCLISILRPKSPRHQVLGGRVLDSWVSLNSVVHSITPKKRDRHPSLSPFFLTIHLFWSSPHFQQKFLLFIRLFFLNHQWVKQLKIKSKFNF